MIIARALALALSALALSTVATAQGVRIVERPDLDVLLSIQDAVDLAQDGDTILVGSGSYGAFTIDGKAVSVLGMPAAQVEVLGTVRVLNVPANKHVTLRGIQAEGDQAWRRSDPGLLVQACAGHVRIVECQFLGGPPTPEYYYGGHGGHGIRVGGSPRTALVRTMAIGAEGYSQGSGAYESEGGAGGDGLRANSTVALYDCSLFGGNGGDTGQYGGNGGHGLFLRHGAKAFASGTPMLGGDGGFADDFIFSSGGRGGDGLRVDGGHAGLLESPAQGGAKGQGFIIDGTPGQDVFLENGGSVTQHPGVARRLDAEVVAGEGTTLTVQVSGWVGDEVRLLWSRNPGFGLPQDGVGARLVPAPMLTPTEASGFVDGNGTLTFEVELAEAPSPKVALFLQGHVIDASGQRYLATPLHLCLLDGLSLPDCNGNGTSDLHDIVTGSAFDVDGNLTPDECDEDCNGNGAPDGEDIQNGTSADCNGNGIPDECDLWFGGEQDCNNNGVLDSCDIDSGDSLDLNLNDIPDECESNEVYHVDAAAGPGGDGSPQDPFQTILEALSICIDNDEIVVLDGTYTGPGNRDLDLGGRNVTIRSQGGAGACTIDCELLGRAFRASNGETNATVQGFRIIQGRALAGLPVGGAIECFSGGLTVRDCAFEDCVADDGGAIYGQGGIRVEGCLFTDCHATTDSGGGVSIAMSVNLPHGVYAVVTDSLFVGCTAVNGGGLRVEGSRGAVISHCTFNGCSATETGGAVRAYSVVTHALDEGLFLHESRFIGNQADVGGALYLSNGKVEALLHGCSFTGNSAATAGGSLALEAHNNPFTGLVQLHNSILWGNAAPSGPEVALLGVADLIVEYSDVQGGPAAVHVDPLSHLDWLQGNLDLDPQFENGHLTLSLASPCIDAGNSFLAPDDRADADGDGLTGEVVPYDAVGKPRIVDIPSVTDTGVGSGPVIDMGAMERQQ